MKICVVPTLYFAESLYEAVLDRPLDYILNHIQSLNCTCSLLVTTYVDKYLRSLHIVNETYNIFCE
jgi:hypothetical protein